VTGSAGFFPEGGKTGFFAVKTGLAKIVFAGKNIFFARIVIKVNFCCTMFFPTYLF